MQDKVKISSGELTALVFTMNEIHNQMLFPILIGDIGGTNARFQILTDRTSEPEKFSNLLTADFTSIEQAIKTGILEKTSLVPRSAIIAAAGPIKNSTLEMTNQNWSIRPDNLMHELSMSDVTLLNDFEAQALAACSFEQTDLLNIGEGRPVENASRVVVGPGTGLGVAGIIHGHGTWIPVPGEGGHVDIGPQSAEDETIWPYLEKSGERMSAEQLVSGPGIQNIYNAVTQREGARASLFSPEEITAAALAGDDPFAVISINLFCGFLGRIAGDLALTFLARGGVFVAGGIGNKIVPFLTNGRFRSEFENKSPHYELLRSIPTYLIIHESAALAGLAAYARDQHRFGLETRGRRWQKQPH